jgi:endo-1,4-beta-xylanase
MIRYKSKKILALILSGVLIAGSVPVTSNAAEQSGESTEEYAESTDGQYTDSTEENRAAGKDTPEESTDEESKPESSAAHTDEESKPEESTVEGSTDEENAAEENTNEENAADENSTKENTTEINSSEESTASETTENVTETETDTTETDTKETETESETETEETEEDFKVLLSDRQIAETDNILSDYNTSFEGTDENGKLHWWNHEAETGAKGSIAQGKYEENQKPSSECGNNYLQVQAESGKNKAYICDSNITGSMKPQVTYEFTYYAKLAEGTDSGEVQFQVTSVSKDWSSQKPASIELDNEITLDAAQWKQVSGTFKLPAHDQHEQVKVEFSGSEGVSFCIDDLRIAAVEDENTGGDRVISNNILSDYNTSFEGVDEGGKLYWWNGPSWSQDGIARKSYEDNKAPISDCGAYYVEVSPYDGKSEAQVNHDNIGAIIQPEIIYEFTYIAKLSEGQESGQVQLEISSDDTKKAEIKLDKEVTLNAAQWQKVSGTFKLPANSSHKAVKIRFTGSENLSFCVDDLRVAATDQGNAEHSDNLVKNPYFAESDLSMWQKAKGDASISTATADKAIFDDIATYGVIENRKSNYDCFAQDMTRILKSGSSYEYSFYVKLDAEDYKDAPEEQREVCFGPYVTVNGTSTYWGSYSSGVLDNGCSKKIPAGEWVKFEGTFNPKFEGEADELIIRILEQGTDNGSGAGIKGKYYVTGVSIHEVKKPIKEIEWDIPNLKDTVSSNDKGIGTDAYTGALLTVSDLSDQPLMDLVQKHFNAVTFENEMKMDAMFGYHDNNNSAPGFDTITWTRADGTEMKDYKVPQLDYSRADKILDALKEWNTNHPDSVIKVRGHVLVWHSQAPEWFFHEDWDINKPDASAEVMDARQEWYIKTVLEHYTGDSSPYKGMFYGWDVVNEAVSDSSGDYRHEDEKSSWWRVYKSEDFIVNAFRYANHYAPSDLELYYNDYNECMGNKVSGIEKLLREVKSHETDEKLPTRIDAMGMQSHHTISSPTVSQIRDAAVRYGKIVGKIQLTELDLKASDDFDGTDATLQNEYTKQAYRYKEIYDVMREVDAMEDIDVNGITVWGVIDGNSWLQDSSDVGGGADGSKKQVPLLFDDDYKAKPSFYAFVNADKLEPYIRSVTVMQAADDNPYVNGKSYEIQGINAKFIPVWSDTELKVQVTVPDASVDAGDEVILYIDWEKSASENAAITTVKMTRAECQAQEDGYIAEFALPRECRTAMNFSMDVVVSDNGKTYAFNDMTMSQGTSSKYFATAITKPYMTIAQVGNGIIAVDGQKETVWDQAKDVQLQIRTGTTKAAVTAKLLWDEQYLYVLADVTDAALDKTSSETHEQDSLEVFIDENNHKSDSYEDDDKQYRINYENAQSFSGPNCNEENVVSAAVVTDKGYLIEAAFKWTEIAPAVGDTIGVELQINDAEGGKRIGTVSWYDESGQGWSSPGVFGTATLGGLIEVEREGLWALEIADVTYTGKALKPPVTVYDGKTLLTLGRDYTVSYKKNTKPTDQAEAVIKGKGNYAGNTTKNFKIVPKNIADEDILIPNLYVKAPKAGKSVTVAPVVTRNGKKLTKKDFAVDSIQDNAGSKVDRVTQPGTYTVAVKGVDANGYTGTKEIQLVVLNSSQVLMSAVKVTGIQNKIYTGDKVVPEFTVKYGQETLEADKDYKVFCDSVEVGTATAVIKGIGEKYVGEKTVTFKITGTVLKPANVQLENASNLYYTGNAIEPVVKISDAEQNRDFTVSYDKNVKAGTATVTVKGIGKYTGTVKKTFKIAPFDIQQNPEGKLSYQTAGMEIPYMKGGSKLKASDLKAVFNGINLVEGTDYTLVYSGNKKLGTATVKIKGKGNFKGTTAPVSFTIHTQDLAKLTNVIISDVANKNARKYTNVSLTIKDFDEKPLKKGTDYSVTFTKTDGTTPITGTPKAGDVIRATIKGKNCYTGEIYKDFRIIDDSADISKAKVEVTPQYYTGKEITLSEINPVTGKQQIFVTINVGGEKKTLREGTDYEIVKHGYTKNINKGTGKMTIRGINQYGGIQTVSFKITAQALDHVEWYENLYKSSMSGIMKILSNKSN